VYHRNKSLISGAFLIDVATKATSASIVFSSELVSDLTTRLPSAVLSAFLKARVKICSDDALVELCATDVLHAVEGVLMGVVFDEAEATGSLLESVKTHDKTLDIAAPIINQHNLLRTEGEVVLGEQLVNLLLGGVEGQVANVEGGRVLKSLLFFLLVLFCFLIIVPALLVLYRGQLGVRIWIERRTYSSTVVETRPVEPLDSRSWFHIDCV
jgi:hypothetical protein